MDDRPQFIDLPPRNINFDAPPRHIHSSHSTVASPRSGDIPPALSPLDAFAFHGRLLARRFEEEEQNGRRLSRLPPLMVAHEIAKARPTFCRSVSQDNSPVQEKDYTPRNAFLEVHQENRPRSQHPLIQSDNRSSAFGRPDRTYPFSGSQAQSAGPRNEPLVDHGYFGIPRSHSPESFRRSQSSSRGFEANSSLPTAPTSNPVQPPGSSLAPPTSARPPRSLGGSPGIHHILQECVEEPDAYLLSESFDSLSVRDLASPFKAPVLPRSPSLTSERSIGSASLPRPSFNFSRPMSRGRGPSVESKFNISSPLRQDSTSTRPSLEVPLRQDSGDSPITPFSSDLPQTPVDSIASDEYFNQTGGPGNTSASYTYSKYSLPRGKTNKRQSLTVEEFFNQHIQWDGPNDNADIMTVHDFSPRPSMEPPSSARTTSPQRRPKVRPPNIVIPQRSASAENGSPRKKTHKHHASSPSATTTSDASTIKARLTQSKVMPADMTPEDHFERGIECHESGALQKSTYHFRLAARAGHSKAMLFYALACRHGWGMKANPAEGVSWLQKAVDSAQLEVADDEDLITRGENADVLETKTHKAQFALSVYELGVSYMNGWGVRQDRSLGLRCFEVAGNWGDVDALAEAGFCYAEGVGCKKDLKKAAKFYRAAEAKGLNIAGNSWIYKDKYMDDESDGESRGRLSRKGTDEQKKRSRSRPRAFFSRKKSAASSLNAA